MHTYIHTYIHTYTHTHTHTQRGQKQATALNSDPKTRGGNLPKSGGEKLPQTQLRSGAKPLLTVMVKKKNGS
jgi:hypothetical protein